MGQILLEKTVASRDSLLSSNLEKNYKSFDYRKTQHNLISYFAIKRKLSLNSFEISVDPRVNISIKEILK